MGLPSSYLGPSSAGKEGGPRAFVLKAARSVAELQPKVNNVADVMVFLEVLGYTKDDALRNGFRGLRDMSQEIFDFVDILEPGQESQPSSVESLEAYIRVPTAGKRLAEGFALSFGWLGSLALLFVAGVSLWLSLVFPLKVTSVFMAGLFAGIIITEGPLQSFNRNFAFYHDQGNVAEAKRVLKRAYGSVGLIVTLTVAGLYGLASLTHFPMDLFAIGMISLISISAHRVIYAIIYSLRKTTQIVVSYLLAFSALLFVYFEMGAVIPNALDRYFYALISAVVVLSVFALYDQLQLLRGKSFKPQGFVPHFWRPTDINKSTIMSRFPVQLWETLPNYLFGTFFFLLLFGDRILSWFFNPIKTANGVTLPFVFNSAYHSGADPALLLIFPALILQYALMMPIFGQVVNATLEHPVTEVKKIQSLLNQRYALLVGASVLSAIIAAVVLNDLMPKFLPPTSLTPTSVEIFRIALVSNIFLVVFFANSLFMQFMNKVMGLAAIALVGVLVVLAGGLVLGPSGFQYVILAYLAATVTVSFVSTVYVLSNLKNASSIFFARYV